MAASPLPAHRTKHISQLRYSFRSSCFSLQQLDDGGTNGTALWLGAQCLSLYLADVYQRRAPPRSSIAAARPRAIELGSGIGLSAGLSSGVKSVFPLCSLALSSLGWDVLATDLPDVVYPVLSGNIIRNRSNLPAESGIVQVRVLDWTVPPEEWVWNDDPCIASTRHAVTPSASPTTANGGHLAPPFNMIISSDTLYAPSLVEPLLRTLHALSKLSVNSSLSQRPPPVYLCVERRDPALINATLSDARTIWNFSVERIPHRKVAKAMEKGGLTWDKEDWEGIEVWKLMLQVPPTVAN